MNMNKYERLNQQKKYSSEKSFSGKKRVADEGISGPSTKKR